jgi:hypothetical protein
VIHPIRYLRGYVYPRSDTFFSVPARLRGADAVRGVAIVLSVVLAFAYGLSVLSGP